MSKTDTRPTDAEMEAVALEVSSAELNMEGEPITPVLDLEAVYKEHPNHEWVNIEDPNGKLHAVKVLKGDVIHFMGTLDDPDLLTIVDLVDGDQTVDVSNLSTLEKVKMNESNRLYEALVLKRFILSPVVTDDAIEAMPAWLRKGMMKAYDHVNGISTTREAVEDVKKKS